MQRPRTAPPRAAPRPDSAAARAAAVAAAVGAASSDAVASAVAAHAALLCARAASRGVSAFLDPPERPAAARGRPNERFLLNTLRSVHQSARGGGAGGGMFPLAAGQGAPSVVGLRFRNGGLGQSFPPSAVFVGPAGENLKFLTIVS